MDPRLRFSNNRFQTKLKFARQFHRNLRLPTKNKFQTILNIFGLKTFFRQILFFFIFLILIFSIYFPNWFFVRQITIQGAGDIETNVREAVLNYFSLHKFWPQQNLLLLKKSVLSAYLEKNITGILKVEKIEKNFFHSLNLKIKKRVDSFLLESQQGNFVVSNDGKITSEIFGEILATSSLNSLLKLKVNLQNKPALGDIAIDYQWLKNILFVEAPLTAILKSRAQEIEIGDLKIPEFGMLFENKSRLYLNYNQDLQKTLDKLKLLLDEISPEDFKKLTYIDLRFHEKAFVCLKTQICSKQAPALYLTTIPTQSTSTINNFFK